MLFLVLLLGFSLPVWAQESHDALVIESAEKHQEHLLVPAMDSKNLKDSQWEDMAKAIHLKQQNTQYGVKVLLVGHTVNEAYENSRDLLELLELHRVNYEVIYVPQDIAEELQHDRQMLYAKMKEKKFPGHKRLKWKHINRKANKGDWLIGSLMGGLGAGINAYLWFYQSPIEPHIAAALTGAYSLPIFAHTLKLKFFDRLYKFKLLGKEIGKKVKAVTEITKRQLVNLFYAELFRFVSGPIGQASDFASLQGQAEVLMHVLAFGTGSATFSAIRNKYFDNKPDHSRWVNFYNFLIMSPLVLRDIGGQYLKSWQVGGLEIHDTTLTVLAANLVLAGSLSFEPVRRFLHKMVEGQELWYQKLKASIKRGLSKCSELFEKP